MNKKRRLPIFLSLFTLALIAAVALLRMRGAPFGPEQQPTKEPSVTVPAADACNREELSSQEWCKLRVAIEAANISYCEDGRFEVKNRYTVGFKGERFLLRAQDYCYWAMAKEQGLQTCERLSVKSLVEPCNAAAREAASFRGGKR